MRDSANAVTTPFLNFSSYLWIYVTTDSQEWGVIGPIVNLSFIPFISNVIDCKVVKSL
jgi:hypothetical protein